MERVKGVYRGEHETGMSLAEDVFPSRERELRFGSGRSSRSRLG